MKEKQDTVSNTQKREGLGAVRALALMALFSALVTVATLVIRIPIPITKGYFNLGDTLIFIAAALLGPVYGLVAGGVGSALADVIGGYVHFSPWTLVIKGLEGFIAGALLRLFRVDPERIVRAMAIFAGVFLIAGLWMVIGYFSAEYVIYACDITPALAELPFNILQGGLSALAATVICPFLMRGLDERLNPH
ncbi:MAG: ECF transporter S component [Deltaproteobacteria bacterium]|nr:ECF transporter S component [Candidatus Zymogenaceae bacterium]